MLRSYLNLICFVSLVFLLNCSGNSTSKDFQTNQPHGFELTKITQGYGTVEKAWNQIDGAGINDRLSPAVNQNKDEFVIFSEGIANLLQAPEQPVAELIRKDLSATSSLILSTQSMHRDKQGIGAFFQNSPEVYMNNFHAFLDKMSSGDAGVDSNDSITAMLHRLCLYLLDSIPLNDNNQLDRAWLNEKADELVEDITKSDFKDDFIDLARILCKLLLQSDYPMWIDADGLPINAPSIDPAGDRNLELGNAVLGTHDMLAWINRIVQNPATRTPLHEAVFELTKIFDPRDQKELDRRLKALILNLEDHFTYGGEIYSSDPVYSANTSSIYSDAELGQTLREFFPLLMQLFMRSDRPNAIITTPPGATPVYPLDLTVSNLRNIGFDPAKIDVERSIDDLMRFDIWGRDRTSDGQAWPVSFFESLLFLTHATSNHGWQDGGNTPEVDLNSDPRDAHGHGKYVEELTLNDALFSIKTHKTLNLLGVYDISLKADDGNHHYRSRTPFAVSEVDELHSGNVNGDDKDYRFFFNQNYGVLQFLAGPGAGDLGSPNGGNPDGESLGLNQYRAYSPNGLNENQLSAWTMGWGVRACFNGEGPYYYADPNAETISMNGQTYRKYLRPNGKIYALVGTGDNQYIYPTEEGDVEDAETQLIALNNRRQRDNRYKSSWHSDYYISHYSTGENAQDHFFTISNSSGNTVIRELQGGSADLAGALTYNELIAENDPKRACASQEEAFFRNYQWVMNEKKMVLIIPLHMNLSIAGRGIVYQILECHGWSGLANLRKFHGNHVWAKAETTGESNLPGDYRIEVVTAATPLAALFVNDSAVYNSTLDCGNATPSIVGQNLPALYRLGFPRSPAIDRGNNISDQILGSKEFEVGDEIWQNRNAFAPLLFSLLAGLREYTPANENGQKPGINSGMRTFLNQIPILIKPLFYFHQTGSAADPPNTWIPRVFGTDGHGNFKGNPFLQSSAEFYSGTPTDWFGSEAEMRHYQPAVKQTILNVLIDGDISDLSQRFDGVLPLVTQTKLISTMLQLLINPSTGTLPLEQWVSTIKFTKGELTAINELPDSAKNMIYPPWMFARGVDASVDIYGAYTQYERVRNEDLILDDLLDWLIGHDGVDAENEGYGLADYPDDKTTEADWQDFDDTVDTLCDLLHPESPYTITPNLVKTIDRILATDELYSTDEISGLLHGIGTLFGRYDDATNQWIYQGETGFDDTFNMLNLRIPAIHKILTQNEHAANGVNANGSSTRLAQGDSYYAQLVMFSNLTDADGVLEFLFNTVSIPDDWKTIHLDVNRFLKGKDISDSQSELWPTVAKLLDDLATATQESKDEVVLDEIYEEYGFQVN